MNDEIKKALEEINILGNTILNDTTYKPTINRREALYNYITNLQENNDNQMKYIADLLVQITNLQQENERLRNHIQMIPYLQTVREKEDYKSRCEKAIEYINNNFVDGEGMICINTGEHTCEVNYNFLDVLLNILKNGSDDNDKD